MKILVVSCFSGTDANVTRDNLFAFRAYSKHDYYYVFDARILDGTVDCSGFDAILIFWTLDLLGPQLSEEARERIARASALKVVFLQDEHRDVWAMNEAMSRLGTHLVFTCVAPEDHDAFYPSARIPSLRGVHTVLPGYVPAYLESARLDIESRRPVDIAYRSRAMPFYLGDLGRDKHGIAERFQAIAAAHGWRSDISVREEDRLYGKRWLTFLRAARCVLGSPSGASTIDFTGDIRRNCERYLARNPRAAYEDVKSLFFADVDWKLVIDTVSPRVFEAAALGCTMVHHEGRHGGILEPDRHYIRVRRDYGNLSDVVARIEDHRFCQELARNAYRDLIASGEYSYRAFVSAFDAHLEREVPRPLRQRRIGTVPFYARNYLRHGQAIIPCGHSFVLAPTPALAFAVAGRVLARRTRGEGRPVLSRFLRAPGEFVTKALATAAAIRRSRALRRLAIASLWLCRGDVARAFRAFDDLRKLDIIRGTRAGDLTARPAFAVAVQFDRSTGIVTFVSEQPRTGRPANLDRVEELQAALIDGKIALVVWDHSALGHQVVYAPGRGRRWLTAGIGPGGVHRFEIISELQRRSPQTIGRELLSLLGWPPVTS